MCKQRTLTVVRLVSSLTMLDLIKQEICLFTETTESEALKPVAAHLWVASWGYALSETKISRKLN